MIGQNELGRKTKLNAGRKKAEPGKRHVATRGERCEPLAETLPAGHDLVAMHRLMEVP